jgi:catechol 2,3-dioxygenase-like lactoylglutathione lyase family enzyme
MIDHVSYAVKNFKNSVSFYDITLALLGYEQVMHVRDDVALYGQKGTKKPYFTIVAGGNPSESIGNTRGFHLAFKAPSKEAVDAWYAKAIELGAKDNGKPGYRTHYHPGYYAAFVIDQNGWRIEAVYHEKKTT